METEVEFTRALPISADRLYVAASPDSLPAYSAFTRLYHYGAGGDPPWTHHDVPFWTVALAKRQPSEGGPWMLAALSEEGDLELAFRGNLTTERIPEAGLRGPSSKGYGYLTAIRWIGEHLCASGGGGQLYERIEEGRWEHADEGLLQARDVTDRLILRTFDGAPDDLYVAGEAPGPLGMQARLFHGDGARFRSVALPPPLAGLNAIHREPDGRVWLAGKKGALLVGDRHAGFKDVSARGSAHLFYDVCRYHGTLYLASVHGLFRYDEEEAHVFRVDTGLSPELGRIHTVEAADGVLWCIGPKEIARFDGKAWTRIHHPDNPAIGG